MSTRKTTWLLITILVAVLIWGSAYPVLAGLLFSDGSSPPVGDLPRDAAAYGTPVPGADGHGLVIPKLPLALTLIPLFPTNTPKPPIKLIPLTLMPIFPTNTPKPPIKLTYFPLPTGIILTLLAPTKTPTPLSATNTPTPTRTPKPTKTPKPTWTPVSPPPCVYDAAYVADVTVPDGSQVPLGAPLQKIWRVQNTGSCAWGPGVRFVFQAGSPLGAPAVQFVPPAVPGATADVAVNMFAPAAPGVYESHWLLRDPDGGPFGPDLFVRIVVAPAQPPATPTPGPFPVATDTPAAVPTLQVITPTPVQVGPAQPNTSSFVALRQAYDLAWPKVSAWSSAAVLSSATCFSLPPQPGTLPGVQFFTPWQGPALGKCGEWRLVFLDSATPQAGAFTAVVMAGQFDDPSSRETVLSGPPGVTLGTDWMDSPAALQAFNRAGGSDFFSRYPDGRVVSFVLRAGPDGQGRWWAAATSRPDYRPGSTLQLNLNAKDGNVDAAAPSTGQPGRTYLTAQEAFAVAQQAAGAWQADAQLVHLKAQVNPDEDGHDVGKASNWWFEFASPGARKGYTLNVVDGVARNANEEPAALGDVIASGWPDSSASLEKLRGSTDFATFSAAHPQTGFSFELLGDAQEGYVWIVGAYDDGGAVTVNVNSLN